MRFDLDQLGAWSDLPFFADTLPAIEAHLDDKAFLPPQDQVFAALARTPPHKVRVVILGQDPYPTPGHAHGFSFSADANTKPLPRSLSNIFKEMRDDIGDAPRHADLRFWADQGVLLLNTVLTVPAGTPQGRKALGWQALTAQILMRLADGPRAYLLWGKPAQAAASQVDPMTNLKIETAHPSPLSARRGFFGARPFSRTNAWLHAQGQPVINWTDPEAQ
ncbi:uracil-DNA glycosylase [Sulfitobacter sp. SK012]|uniref:uracil-DNA glycosylase n=1 Tax=Sulfitobacter sp. SK012 TaxID=1389005 RepID=UPI000E0ACA81|nr:uracil-DNA glycosylase [Sulfitobacter sp. SK012]AXI46160.1 uracil-DNA glycosylase [Sulfitobacter sp. SK012]